MLRPVVAALALSVGLSAAQAASPEEQLSRHLQEIAKASSENTPRAINEDMVDNGYSVEGLALINHIAVSQTEAREMRDHPEAVRIQLTASVCTNEANQKLMLSGAELRYEFKEFRNQQLITVQAFNRHDCML